MIVNGHRSWWAVMLIAAAFVEPTSASGESISLEQLRNERREAAQRERRVVFNNDGNEPIYLCQDTTPEELLRHRTSDLADTHVDAIFYCTWSSGFGMFTHDTQVGHVFNTQEGLFSKNKIDEMLAAGTDPLQVMVEFGKENAIEIFWSFRMNDTHDASGADYGPIMFRANPLKQEHPEWLIGSPANRPKHGGWSAVDFTRPEIRELAVRYVEEVCRNYDVDGIELDFFRHPVFFKRAAQTGTACNDEERAMMTEMLRRVRDVSEVEGRRRGRPILVAVRVPDSVEYSRDVGLDIEHWLEEGLIDLLVASGYYQLNDWETSVALGNGYGVPVYPSLDESRVREPAARKLRMSVEAYRGRALNSWHAGTHGVYLFNAFDPKNPIWRELGDPEMLVTLDHDYFASIRGVGSAAGGALPHRDYQNVPTLNPRHPVVLKPGEPVSIKFPVGGDLEQAAAKARPQIRLRLQVQDVDPSELSIALNGQPLDSTQVSDDWYECSLEPGDLNQGANRVTLTLADDAEPARWADLHCTVRWPSSSD